MVVLDYLQLPPVRDRFISENKMNQLLSIQLWHSLKYTASTKIARQNVLNSLRLGTFDKNTEKILKSRIMNQSEKIYPHGALHMYAENAPTLLRNQTVLSDLNLLYKS